MADQSPATFRHTMRFLCAALLGSQVVILLAVAAPLGQDGVKAPPLWAVLVVVVVGVGEALLLGLLGKQVQPLAPGTSEEEVRAKVVATIRQVTLLRLLVAEAVTFVGVALGVSVKHGGTLVCLLGVAISLTLSVLYVWPGARVLQALRDRLESAGVPAQLDAILDAPPPGRAR